MFLGAGSVATGEAGTPEPTRVVMVEPGDTLWGIAAEAGDSDAATGLLGSADQLAASIAADADITPVTLSRFLGNRGDGKRGPDVYVAGVELGLQLCAPAADEVAHRAQRDSVGIVAELRRDRVDLGPELVDMTARRLPGHPPRARHGDAPVERGRDLVGHERPAERHPGAPRLVLAPCLEPVVEGGEAIQWLVGE